MFHLAYLKSQYASPAGRANLIQKVVRLYRSKPDTGADLIYRMIDARRLIDKKRELLIRDHRTARAGAEREAIATEHGNLGIDLDCVNQFLRDLRNEVVEEENLLAWAILRVRFDRVLDNQRLSDLRNLMSEIDNTDNYDHVVSWIQEQVDIFCCADCGEWEFTDCSNTVYSHDGSVCRVCIEGDYTYSDYYGEYIQRESVREARMPDQTTVYVDCEDDRFHWDDDTEQYVHEEWEPVRPPIIANYHSSKNSFLLKIDDWARIHNMFFGAELEVEVREGDRYDKATYLNELINGGEIGKDVFFENDGSINHGFEIITQPMSLPAHRNLWSWVNNRNATKGLRSHMTDTCGLHVHVSRTELTGMQIAKMIAFVNDPDNEALIRAIARRYASGYCKIKSKKVDPDLSVMESTDRYEAINITPRKTIEFRIFKGSLNYKAIIAALEFTYSMCEFTKGKRFEPEHLKADRYLDFVRNEMADESATLIEYINQRMGLSETGQQEAETAAESAVTA